MPQITEAEWKKQLEKGVLKGFYFVYGPEKYLVQRSAARVKEKASEGPFPDFNLQVFDGTECSLDELAEAVEALPFMAEEKYVLVSDLDVEARNAGELEKLYACLEDVPESTVLFFYLPGLTPDMKRSAKWKKFLSTAVKKGNALEFPRRTSADLEKLLGAAAGKHYCVLTRENARRMINLCGNDLQTLFNELEKLCAYVKEGEIPASVIDRLVTKNLETTVFALSKDILAGRYEAAYGVLDTLFSQNEEPGSVLAVLSSAYLDLYRVRAALQSGETALEPSKHFDYKNKEFRLRNAERDGRKLSTAMLRQSLEALSAADAQLKGGRGDRKLFQRLTMEKLIAELLWIAEKEKIS